MTWPTVRIADERFVGLPDFPFTPRFTDVDGIRMHFVDEGSGPPVVLFHGEPTWSFLYRKVIPAIVASGHRAIAFDYPGFGRSDHPTDPDLYTYDRLVEFSWGLLEQLELEDATAVVQDWGGPIGLRVVVEHPERFRRIVVMNTGLFSGDARPSEGFLAWRRFVERTDDLPIGLIMANAAATPWPAEVLAAYEAPFPDPASKVGARQLPLIVPLSAEDPGAAEMAAVKERLASFAGPTLVLFGTEDPIFSVRVGERWAERIPGAGPLELVEGAGHFLQEDAGEEVGRRIAAFLTRT